MNAFSQAIIRHTHVELTQSTQNNIADIHIYYAIYNFAFIKLTNSKQKLAWLCHNNLNSFPYPIDLIQVWVFISFKMQSLYNTI